MSIEEARLLRQHSNGESLISRSIVAEQQALDRFLSRPIDIPGHGEAGGYEHNCHKQNYIHLHLAGKLWLITEDVRYHDLVVNMLSGYADIYPALTLNTSKDSNPPGRLFHQTLNENMWLLYASDAYSCVYASLSEEQRRHIEGRLLREMATMFTDTYAHDFDIVHNHGLWSVAAVGMCGYAINDQSLVDKALYGLKGDSTSGGFLAQLKQLFSPDGYYMEGPYYHRFALRPLLLFAEAIQRRQPELDIYNYQDQIIRRTTFALMATAFPDGSLPALNDASKTMNINDEGILIATSLCFSVYGQHPTLVAMAQQQGRVWTSAAGQALSEAAGKTEPQPFNWGSLLLNDGANGDRGGLGILRQRDNKDDMNMTLLWFGQHGSDHQLHSALDHGHFDGLHLSWFNRGQEVLQDYGFGRWVNVEPKFGGRYIPENKSYCKQTIAHNTVVVDETSQNCGDTATAEQHWGQLHFFCDGSSHKKGHQGISARLEHYYDGVDLQRTVLMLNLDGIETPVLLDLFKLSSPDEHQYDYPLHYNGQIIRTNFEYVSDSTLSPLGKDQGYQHLWKLGSGRINKNQGAAMVSWLMGSSYYSMVTALPEGGAVIFCRTGANDPQFNLRNEPCLVVRTRGRDQIFATAFETHGYFNEAVEASEQARGDIEQINVLRSDDEVTVVRIIRHSTSPVLVLVSNSDQPHGEHRATVDGDIHRWEGPYQVIQG
jgi:hypothetical protein